MEQKTSLLQKKIEDVRSSLKDVRAEKSTERIGVVLIVLSDLLGGLLVGCALAYILCHVFGAHVVFGGLLILLGGIAGFFNIYKSMQKVERKRGKNESENFHSYPDSIRYHGGNSGYRSY